MNLEDKIKSDLYRKFEDEFKTNHPTVIYGSQEYFRL